MSKERTRTEIYERFKELPGRTLIAWSKAAGLVEADRKLVWSLPRKEKKFMNLSQFQTELVALYKDLTKSEMIGIEKIFVEIHELRQKICIEHNWDFKEFDDYLTRLLDSTFGESIRLYGGPSSAFKEMESFMYQKRTYLYIRIKV
jgi:hypothetical protein